VLRTSHIGAAKDNIECREFRTNNTTLLRPTDWSSASWATSAGVYMSASWGNAVPIPMMRFSTVPRSPVRAANGLALPFPDQAFEIVHASAVLEHVGSAANQTAFVLECCRVTRKTAFFTTPNRWYPVEVHTLLPLVHWLPKSTFRALLRKSGYGFFAEESNLNLLTSGELHAIAAQIDGFSCKVSPVTFLGWPSHLLLIAQRKK